MPNPSRTISARWLALLVACTAPACAASAWGLAQTPSPPPDRAAFEVLWQHPIDMPDGTEEAPWLAVGATAAFVAGPNVGLVAFDAGRDGAVLWSSPQLSARPPVAAGDVVVVVSDEALVALRQDRNEVAWRVDLDESPSQLVAMGDRFGAVVGQELRTWDAHGAPGWRASLGAATATPLVFDMGVAYVGLDDASIIALDAAEGSLLWRLPLAARPESLIVAGDRLYLSAANGHLYSYPTTGKTKTKWDYRKVRAIGQPVADEGHVYFTLLDNTMYAFDRSGGSERWHTQLADRPVTGPLLLADSLAVPLASGHVAEVRKDGHIRQPATPPNLLASLTLQAAVVTADATRVLTVTTTQDLKRTLTAWGLAPKR